MDADWNMKYRPRTLKDVVGQDKVVSSLVSCVLKKDIPNILLIGPSGTGKASCALALSKDLECEMVEIDVPDILSNIPRKVSDTPDLPDDIADVLLSIPSYSTRSRSDVMIDIIRKLASIRPLNGGMRIIFLNDAGEMTSQMQASLRRVMEVYPYSRFILSCEFASQIIDPLQSRCSIYRLNPLGPGDMEKVIRDIAEKEDIILDDDAAMALVFASKGNLRYAIGRMQSAAVSDTHITADSVLEATDDANARAVEAFIQKALDGSFSMAKDMLSNLVSSSGMDGREVLYNIHNSIQGLSLTDRQKIKLIDKIAETDLRLVEGDNDIIQLEPLLAYFVMLGRDKR